MSSVKRGVFFVEGYELMPGVTKSAAESAGIDDSNYGRMFGKVSKIGEMRNY